MLLLLRGSSNSSSRHNIKKKKKKYIYERGAEDRASFNREQIDRPQRFLLGPRSTAYNKCRRRSSSGVE